MTKAPGVMREEGKLQPKLLNVGSDKRVSGNGGGGGGGGGADGGWSGEGVEEGCDALSTVWLCRRWNRWRSSQKVLGAIWGSASGDGKRASHALEAPIDRDFVLGRTPWKKP